MIDVRTAPAPIETVTPIKPAEAIRLGCLIAPTQWFGNFSIGPNGEACAISAMRLARGWDGQSGDAWMFARPSEFAGLSSPCGCLPSQDHTGMDAIWHLNDRHRWSREQIADWLEGLGL